MKNYQTYSSEENNDDIKILAGSLSRNKLFIGSTTLIFFLLSFIYSLNKKNIWEGGFEIVLDQKKESPINFLNNRLLEQFTNINDSYSLKTEIGILDSQSVLMPIFNDFKESNPKTFPNFSSFQNSLEVDTRFKTSILKVNFKNTEKAVILPVLTKISKTYQNYTNKNRQDKILATKKYLSGQINIYKKKSKDSIRNAQEFAIDQDLLLLDLNVENQSPLTNQIIAISDIKNNEYSSNEENILISNIDIEKIRVKAANEIRKIDQQIISIEEMGDEYKKLKYLGSNIPDIIKEGLPQTLAEIEEELLKLRTKYTDKDPLIKQKMETRNLLIENLRNRSIGYLKAERLDLEATINSATRPKGILLKYKELIREASRDEKTLIALENKLREIELSESRVKTPWKLITEPTLKNGPVGPNRSKIWFISSVIGLIGSFSFCYVKELKSGIIFEESILKKLLPAPILKRLKIYDNEIKETDNDLLIDQEIISENKIFIILSNKIKLNYYDQVYNFFSKIPNKYQLISINENFPKESKKNEFLFLTSLGKTDKMEIENLKIKLSISEIDLKGILLI